MSLSKNYSPWHLTRHSFLLKITTSRVTTDDNCIYTPPHSHGGINSLKIHMIDRYYKRQ